MKIKLNSTDDIEKLNKIFIDNFESDILSLMEPGKKKIKWQAFNDSKEYPTTATHLKNKIYNVNPAGNRIIVTNDSKFTAILLKLMEFYDGMTETPERYPEFHSYVVSRFMEMYIDSE